MTNNSQQYKTKLLRGVCIAAAVVAVLLLACSIIFSGKSADIFGTNIWLVQTDAFSAIHKGSAVISKRVSPQEIFEDNIVIYRADNRDNIGLVKSVAPNGEVYHIAIVSEHGVPVSATDSDIVGKAELTSLVLGLIIAFVTSPVGMLVIIFIPCGLVVITEYINANRPAAEVSVHKKSRAAFGVPAPAEETSTATLGAGSARYADTPTAIRYADSARQNARNRAKDKDDLNRTGVLPVYDRDRGEFQDPGQVVSKAASVADRYSMLAEATRLPGMGQDLPSGQGLPKPKKQHQPLSQSRLNRIMAETQRSGEPVSPLNTLKINKLEAMAEEMKSRHTPPAHAKTDWSADWSDERERSGQDTYVQDISDMPARSHSEPARREIGEIGRNAALEIQREKEALERTQRVARGAASNSDTAKEITQAFAKIPADETEQRLAKLARANDRPLAFPEALRPGDVHRSPTVPVTRTSSGRVINDRTTSLGRTSSGRIPAHAAPPVISIPPLNTTTSRGAGTRPGGAAALGQTAALPNFKDMLRDEPDDV